jgi:hypothetical protein
MRVALLLPPSTQLNTPYPATAYLARALRAAGHGVHQDDLGLKLALRVFSAAGLRAVFDAVEAAADEGLPEPAWEALACRERHEAVVPGVVAFLQGRDPSLAAALVRPGFLPRGPRVRAARGEAFGRMGQSDHARYLASLYLEDLADLVASTVDAGFGFARYQHHLAVGPVSYGPIAARLAGDGLLDTWLDALVDEVLAQGPFDALGVTVPFPGTLYGALRIGQRARRAGVPVLMGGGYVNTELREVDEPRLWDSVDALTYDDGEGPVLAWLEARAGGPDRRHRTRDRGGLHAAPAPARPFNPAPDYAGLPLGDYLQVLDTLNPAHRIWSDCRWNKVTLAHGCYWKRCAFCDVNLDYIARFEPARTGALVDAMEEVVAQTGVSGFHLVDEAAPPRALRDLALAVLARGHVWSFWGNIRFERAFTPDLCRLLAAAGLIAVTGGLEVASDRVLALMDKGITVEQAARAAAAFRQAGVMVHAYLMYGFPTETAQETVDAAEVVRQLFAAGALSSAFWHRFVLTRHSRVFTDPGRYGVHFTVPTGVFATNDLPHHDPTGADADLFDAPLERSLGAWMRGEGLDRPTHSWFPRGAVPRAAVPEGRVAAAIAAATPGAPEAADRPVWTGLGVLEGEGLLRIFGPAGARDLRGSPRARAWVAELLDAARPSASALQWGEVRAAFPGDPSRLDAILGPLRAAGLLFV